jgi:hypothetical protein
MKKTIKVQAIRRIAGTQSRILCAIALLALIAFSMAACDSDFGGDGNGGGGNTDSRLNGTWFWRYPTRDVGFTFNNGYYEYFYDMDVISCEKGTYTTAGNILTLTATHFHGYYDTLNGEFIFTDDGWNLPSFAKWYTRTELKAFGVPENYLVSLFSPITTTYSISGNKLYIIGFDGYTDAYTKR